MCGIAGIITPNGQVNKAELKIMTDVVSHRGPDGDGFYIDNNLGFGHRRLSIIDLSHAGDQPMKLGDELVIVFNGEIYNYLELREELKVAGCLFKTDSDTEVILIAYQHWGQECVSKFNGMWAFAIHDVRKNIVFCSRDRFGVKPFYYTTDNGKFFFGSEIKQFLHTKSNWFVNNKVLIEFLVFGLLDHTPQTFFEGIVQLPGSHNLIYDLGENTFSIHKYYSIKIHPELSELDENDSIKKFHEVMYSSVNIRLRSDVKVGTCLSGGLDSSYIAALAAPQYKNDSERFTAITAQSLNKEEDETLYAEKVVNGLDLQWLKTCPTTGDFLTSLDEVIYNQEEPFLGMSIYMQHFVMKKAKEAGVVVLLDGQGADELLLGYQRYMGAYFKSLPLKNLILNINRSKNHFGVSALKIVKIYFYFTFFWVRKKRNVWRFRKIKKTYIDQIDFEAVKNISTSYTDIGALQKLEIFSTQLPSLLRFEDKNSMASSIESRLPFLDYRFVETALSLNNEFKIKEGWSKYILRKSMQGLLPDDIIWRKKKIGFNAPTSIWFNGFTNVKAIINKSSILNKLYGGNIPDYDDETILWRLINVARWEELYNVQIK